ncbi:BolA family protein [Methylomagnum sp.]
MTDRVEMIRSRLEAELAPTHLEIIDDSQAHAGHAGARQGGGHFSALIVSRAFEGKSPVQRHQLVYRTLGELMSAEIHALSIKALTPSEYQ